MIKFSIRPLYLQVRDSLAERIALGDWKPNTAVPNEMELARELGVSPGTMRKALDLLESEGLVTRQQGRGTFINDLTSPALASRYSHFCSANGERVVGELKALDIYAGLASDAECERLQLTPGPRLPNNALSFIHGQAILVRNGLPSDAALPRPNSEGPCVERSDHDCKCVRPLARQCGRDGVAGCSFSVSIEGLGYCRKQSCTYSRPTHYDPCWAAR